MSAYVLSNGQRVYPAFVLNDADGGGIVTPPASFRLADGTQVMGVVLVDEDGNIAEAPLGASGVESLITGGDAEIEAYLASRITANYASKPICSLNAADSTSAGTLTQNMLYLWRFSVPAVLSVNALDYITGGPVDGNVCGAIYASDGTTLTRLVTSGSIAIGGSSTTNTVTLAEYDLQPGVDYFGAFGSDSATAQFRRATMSAASAGIGLRLVAKAAAFPAPATIDAADLPASATAMPTLALRG